MKKVVILKFIALICSTVLFIHCTKEESSATEAESETLVSSKNDNTSSSPNTKMDTDGDGVMDDLDKCPATPKDEEVDAEGCPLSGLTYVPDDAFEQYLIDKGYDDLLDDYVLTGNINSVEEVIILGFDYEVADLTGLEDFVSLILLSLESIPLTGFEVSKYKKLESLYLFDIPLTSLIIKGTCLKFLGVNRMFIDTLIVSENHSLTSFGMEDGGYDLFVIKSNPEIKTLDFIDIFTDEFNVSDNKNLESYFCNSCGHRSMSFINNANFESFGRDFDDGLSIESLMFNDNPNLTSIVITDLPKLTHLDIKNNGLVAIDVSGNDILATFDATGNPLTCIKVNQTQLDNIPIDWVKDPEDFYSLDCADTDGDGVPDGTDKCPGTPPAEAVNIDGCSLSLQTYVPDDAFEQYLIDKGYDDVLNDYVLTENIKTVEEVELLGFEYAVADLTGLEDFKALKKLYLEDALITEFDISKYKSLVNLTFFNVDNLTSLIIQNTCLESLGITNMVLDTFLVSNNHSLKNIDIEDGNFNDFIVEANPVLGDFFLMDVFFNKLVVKDNKTFKTFFCNSCTYNSINFTNNENFDNLALDIGAGFSLETLVLNDNPNLASVPFEDLLELILVDVKNNGLTEIDVSANTALTTLDVTGNPLTCIKVNQNQLDNIPADWVKDAEDGYALDCN